MLEIIFPEESKKQFCVVVLYLDGGVFDGLVILEIRHEEPQEFLADNDDEKEVDGTHHGAIGRNKDIGGFIDTKGNLQRSKVGITSCVESRQHASDVGKERWCTLSIEKESDGDGNGTT